MIKKTTSFRVDKDKKKEIEKIAQKTKIDKSTNLFFSFFKNKERWYH